MDTTAIITYNDLIAVGIVLRFTADGVNVPGDVSVIGFDNTLIAPVVMPPITSIRIPRAQLGQVAVRRLLLMMISPMILLGGCSCGFRGCRSAYTCSPAGGVPGR